MKMLNSMEHSQKVFIYKGPGASRASIQHLKESLSLFLPPETLAFLSPRELLRGEWREHAHLLAMPGGRDLPYVKYLHGQGTEMIRQFVEKGGSYLGICAGAYFAAKEILFDQGPPHQPITGERALSFFEGRVQGPLFSPYDPNSFLGMRAVSLKWNKAYPWAGEGVFVMNGGGFFEAADQIPEIEILASYGEKENSFPLILHRFYGLGQVLLSQPHIEYVPALLEASDPFIANSLTLLHQRDSLRQLCFRFFLQRLLPTFFPEKNL
ncbi:MAG: BPL-N domain-containing protein [Holosporales bacterium]